MKTVRRVGVDIGGTFTDLVAYDDVSQELRYLKVLTNPVEPWKSVIEALEALGWDLESVEVIVHATTLGTNMFFGQMKLEKPTVALITNAGFRDVLEIGRQNRPELYSLFFEKPKPLVPRRLRVGVRGRIGPNGREIEPLDVESLRKIVRKLCKEVNVFAIAFLHSYLNPSHELIARKVVKEECPSAQIVLSHEVDPQPKEYERTSTTVVNAILKPVMSRYISMLGEELRRRGYKHRILVMQSSGGVVSEDEAIRIPAAFVESGPAAGAVAVSFFAKLEGVDYALGFDMGGTTAKASSIINGEPLITTEYEIGGKVHMGRLIKGSGYPVRYPFIDLAEVSAGGGTIAWVDVGGALRVGPMSAGADPGPACYGRGGMEPTVTDANLVLGRLPVVLAGGRLKLNRELAVKAIEKLSSRLGMDVVETASSIIRLANVIMAKALRLVTVERGYDPRRFTMFAFGGAGPLHAAELVQEVGVKEVVVPPYPGVFSAFGLLVTDYRHDLYKAIVKPVSQLHEEDLEKVFDELEKKAINLLKSEGVTEKRIKLVRYLDMRYRGQAYELTVPYRGSLEAAEEEFHQIHAARYGFDLRGEDVIVGVARVTAYGIVDKPKLKCLNEEPHEPSPHGKREVFFEREGWVEASIYDRLRLKPGATIHGPAVIESPDSTIVVPPRFSAYVDCYLAVRIALV